MFEEAVHTGRIYRWKKSGGGRWKECWLVLQSSGQLIWFNDKKCTQMAGSVDLRKSMQSVCIGRSAVKKHGKGAPRPPMDFAGENFMAIPSKKNGEIQWLYTKTEKDLAGWVRALATVMGRSTAFEVIYDKHRKTRRPRDMRRVPSGDDDEKFRRLGLSIRAADTKKAEEELGKPEINWGAVWDEIMTSKPTVSQRSGKPTNGNGFLRNGGPTLPSTSSGTGDRQSDNSSSGGDTWDLPASEDGAPEKRNENALLEEVMTVVADVHSTDGEVVVEKF